MFSFEIAKKEFAIYLRETREKSGLTVEEVSKMAFISSKTLSRLEKGRCLPQYDTLYLLSTVYKINLNQVFIDIISNVDSDLEDLIKLLNSGIESENKDLIKESLEKLKNIEEVVGNKNIGKYIEQSILFGQAIILITDGELLEAKVKLIEAIKLTINDFDIDNIDKNSICDDIEIRIIMNIGTTYCQLGLTEKGKEIFKFCISKVKDIGLYIKILNSLSIVYFIEEEFEKSYKDIKRALDISIKEEKYNALPKICYQKAIVERKLKLDDYNDTFNMGLVLCYAFNKKELKQRLIESFKFKT